MGARTTRWKARLWPSLRDAESARQAVERAARVTTLWAIINLAIGLIALFSGSTVTDDGEIIPGAVFLVIGGMFALIAWKIRSMSRGWTVGGLVLAAFMLCTDLAARPSPLALIFHGIVLLYFVNAVRGAVFFERLQLEPRLPGPI